MSTEDILETFHFHVLKRFLSVSVKLSAMFLRRLKHVTGLLGSDHAVARITFPASSDLFEGLGQINYIGESGYTDDYSIIFFQS